MLCTLAPLTCCGCSVLLLRYQAVWSPPLPTACVCDLCRVRVLVRLSHPRPPDRNQHGVPWVSCRDPPVCSRCPGSMASVAERQLVLCCVVLRCGVWWCIVHVVVWIVSSLRFVMCPLAERLENFCNIGTWSCCFLCRWAEANRNQKKTRPSSHWNACRSFGSIDFQ